MAIKETAIIKKPLQPLTAPTDFKRQNREGFPQTDDNLNTGNLKANVTANHINVARRIVKNVVGVNYLTKGGHFLSNSIAFELAHSILVAKEMKTPYNLFVRERIVKHYYINKLLYRRIADLVNKSKV